MGTTNGEGLVGETTRMSCKYQGKPIPDIRWLRQGRVIETDDVKYRVTVDNESSEKEVTSFLEIVGYVVYNVIHQFYFLGIFLLHSILISYH